MILRLPPARADRGPASRGGNGNAKRHTGFIVITKDTVDGKHHCRIIRTNWIHTMHYLLTMVNCT